MRSVQAIVASHIAFNNSNVTLDTWSFVYFKNIFGIDEVSAGRMFSVPLTLSSILGNVVAGVGESGSLSVYAVDWNKAEMRRA